MDRPRTYKFCVIGAGIIGMSSAYCLAKSFPGCSIKIVYGKNTHIASFHGFGYVSNRTMNMFDHEKISMWSKQTTEYCAKICRTTPKIAEEMGINVAHGYSYEDRFIDCGLKPIAFSYYREANDEEYEELKIEERYEKLSEVFGRPIKSSDEIKVAVCGSFVVDGQKYVTWTRNKLNRMVESGQISEVQFVEKHIQSISEVDDGSLDLIVNCSGMGAEYLAGDNRMVPIRGIGPGYFFDIIMPFASFTTI